MATTNVIAAPTTPTEDFTDNGDGTVTHRITGLTWMRCAMGMTWTGTTCTGTASTYTWDQATKLTANFAGKSDWRLPSIAELSGIIERGYYGPAINKTVFPNTPNDVQSIYFWSGSLASGYSNDAWRAEFLYGSSYHVSHTLSYSVRLVRSGQSFSPLALYTPTTDFIDNGNGTVTHMKTGLMWKRCAEGQTWSGSTCSGTASSYDWNTAVGLTSSSAGYSDWRLPSVDELLSIVEYQNADPAINSSIFPNMLSSSFWSRSIGVHNSSSAWFVYFSDGSASNDLFSASNCVRLVRRGQFFTTLGFGAQTGVAPNAVITSTSLTVINISGGTPISITGGSYAINGGPFTSVAGTVSPYDSVTLRITSSLAPTVTSLATLLIGSISGSFSVTTAAAADTQVPSVPINLRATTHGDSGINLTWNAASDNVGVTTYQLYRDDVWLKSLGNVTSYTDIGLIPGPRHSYRIAACDAFNNCSAQSQAASVTTSNAHVLTYTTPNSDFTDNGDGTVTHRITGLAWMRCAMGMKWTGTTCTGAASTYTWEQANALTGKVAFAKNSDWRLPSIAELNSIVERNSSNPSINNTVFPNIVSSYMFWSSSLVSHNLNTAWFVDFQGVFPYSIGDLDFNMSVRLVRSGQSFSPLALYTPTTDFIDNGNGTVTHMKTGLMWKRCAEGQTWSGSTCSDVAASYDWDTAVGLTSSSAGYSDWRLPSVDELQSLVEYQAYSPSINTTIFPNTPHFSFWSYSRCVYDRDSAWHVGFEQGGVGCGVRSNFGYCVRLVRRGQFFSRLGFAPQASVAPSALTTSASIKVAPNVASSTPISIVGGSYSVNGGTYTATPGNVNPGDTVTIRLTSAATLATTVTGTLTIGDISGDFAVTTRADTVAPSPSATLAATAANPNQINLSWSGASDNVGVANYRIYRNNQLLTVVSNTTSYTDTDLTSATRFAYSVSACDAAGNCSTPSPLATASATGTSKTSPILVAGANHAGSVTSSGNLLLWGNNDSGQIGISRSTTTRSWPLLVGAGYTSAALGGSHSVALKSDGSLWTWGGNAAGQLGDGGTASRSTPAQIGSGYSVIAAGDSHTLTIKTDGSLWAWGNSGTGQLGDGTANSRTTPVQIGTGYYAIAAGTSHSIALKTDGSLWAWGSNVNGQLGDGTGNDRYAPTYIGNGFTAIAAGAFHTLALKADGSLWAWGKNTAGQLGDGTTQNRYSPIQISTGYRAITAGTDHSLGLKTDGSVWAWGSNVSGQVDTDGTASIPTPRKRAGLTSVTSVAAGANSSLAQRSDGSVWSWGANNTGQLGIGTFAQPRAFALAINSDNNGYLNLTGGSSSDIPADVSVPFFVSANGGITATTADVKTTTKFNSADLGKSGEVYVTARVPTGSLGTGNPTVASLSLSQQAEALLGAVIPSAQAQTTSSTYTLIQLTPTGWQPVTNGQLIPYASGVLGDAVAAQTILSGTDTTNLKGAEFCLGYGTSAAEMSSAGRSRTVATIPDPNGTSSNVGCLPVVLAQGWNLMGNGLNTSLQVASVYGDTTWVTSVWKWDAAKTRWQFYAPIMDSALLNSFTAERGYAILSTINPGEGYWVNTAKQGAVLPPSGSAYTLMTVNLVKGWNLSATGKTMTPSGLNQSLDATSSTNFTSLWAWDNANQTWYFYAPSLEAQGGTALADYLNSKGYKDFSAVGKTLGPTTGFWVNR